jgi:PAS domain S-box-containing protein
MPLDAEGRPQQGGVDPTATELSRYRLMLDALPIGAAMVHSSVIVYANNHFVRMLGYSSRQEIVGTHFLMLVDRGSRKYVSLMMQRLSRGEAVPARMEIQMLHAGGASVTSEVTLTQMEEEGDRLLLISLVNIHDRKELEKRLIDSERLFQNVVNSMADALLITDLRGKVIDVNAEFEKLTGYPRSEAVGAVFPYPWIDEDDLRRSLQWLEGLRSEGSFRDADMTWLKKSGRRMSVSLNTTLLRNSIGDPMIMLHFARDISERENSRRELDRQLQMLGVLYELSKELGATLDQQHIARLTFRLLTRVLPLESMRIRPFDAALRSFSGTITVRADEQSDHTLHVDTAAEPLIQGSPEESVLSNLRTVVQQGMGSQLNGRKPREQAEPTCLVHVPLLSSGHVIGLLSALLRGVSRASDEHEAMLEGVSSLLANAMEKARLHEQTVAKSREVEARNRELDDFTYVVSHDLKEPLISVEGYARILGQELARRGAPAEAEYVGSIISSCSHMKSLINDLLQLSRVGRTAEHIEVVRLSDIIAEVLEELDYTISLRKARIDVQADLPEVRGVTPHLKLVFRNLLSNALKFCDKPFPEVEIRGVRDGAAARISVKDNGIGIDAEHRDKVFMIFQRLHKRDEYEGTGAGLSIVRKVIETHGGRIWLESEPGRGSTFFFTLPLA